MNGWILNSVFTAVWKCPYFPSWSRSTSSPFGFCTSCFAYKFDSHFRNCIVFLFELSVWSLKFIWRMEQGLSDIFSGLTILLLLRFRFEVPFRTL